jgi:glucose-6-phosphate dehydrogenase assembly protein OpcA
MAGTIEPIGLGEPRPANVADLEAELSALWRSAAEDPAAKNAVTRACTLTLLIYAENDEAANEVSNLVAEVTRQNPCRTIIMMLEPEASPSGLEAWVSAHCHLPVAGEKQVCSEQITLRARGEAVQGLPSVVLPLTVSDLPIFLWWRAGDFSPPPYFAQILRVTQHVIVDTARFSPSGTHLQDLAAWLHKFRIQLTDLNWSRITPWRELIAQGFDSPDRRPYLDRLSEVRIEYEQDSARLVTQRAQGLLVTGWLASRLGWEFLTSERREEAQPRTFYFKSAAGKVKVERNLKRVDNACGVCFTIELIAEGPSTARFLFTRGPDGKVVKTLAEVPGSLPMGRSVRVEVLNEAEILNEELKLGVRDRGYEEALSVVARMIAS